MKVLSDEFAPIAEVFDHPEEPMTTRERLKSWYDEQKATSRAEGLDEGLEQGIQKGLQEGLQKGIEKGRTEGQRTMLAKLLKLKFGALDAAAEARLANASTAQLNGWAKRVLSASSLDEIWS